MLSCKYDKESPVPIAAFDLDHPDLIAHELAEAGRALSRVDAPPPSVRALVEELSDQVVAMGIEPLTSIDTLFWAMLQNAALSATRALQVDDEREQRRRLRVSLEQLRFLFARLAEGREVAEDRDPKEVARWLAETLAVSQRRLAELLGVGDRTLQRWLSRTDATSPDGEDARRLWLVARLASQLRHSFAGAGVTAWLEEPNAGLEGARPTDLLADPGQAENLMRSAIASRLSIAT